MNVDQSDEINAQYFSRSTSQHDRIFEDAQQQTDIRDTRPGGPVSVVAFTDLVL